MKLWILLAAVTLVSLLYHVQARNDYIDCSARDIDLVFVIDDSGSIREERFQLVREFVEQLSAMLDIGLLRNLVGVILFSRTAFVHFSVTTHTTAATLLPAINPGLPYRGRSTRTDLALELLVSAGGDGGELELRPGFPNVAIVITDGRSTNATATIIAANALHASNIYDQVYAVGVGSASLTELNTIASDPSLVFFNSSFDNDTLTALQQNITQELCNTHAIFGDPHFRVPLLSGATLCYSIQGYPGLIFNLIYNEDFVINALFVDSIGDKNEATWIGKLAVIPRHANKSEAVIFDSITQEVVMVDQGHFRASVVDKISYDKDGKMSVKFTPGISKQAGNPTVHVKYDKPLASFDVTFFSNHLDVNWDLKYDSVPKIHGLMGQFMAKGIAIDLIKKILTYSDGCDPVPVEIDEVMTGKKCWKAMNPGHQGEGLIKGSILDYMVSNLLEDDFKLKV